MIEINSNIIITLPYIEEYTVPRPHVKSTCPYAHYVPENLNTYIVPQIHKFVFNVVNSTVVFHK